MPPNSEAEPEMTLMERFDHVNTLLRMRDATTEETNDG